MHGSDHPSQLTSRARMATFVKSTLKATRVQVEVTPPPPRFCRDRFWSFNSGFNRTVCAFLRL